MLRSNFPSIRISRKELFFFIYLLVVIGIHRYFSIQGILLFIGGIIGFCIPLMEKHIDALIPKSVGEGVHSKHSIFKSPEVLLSYLVFSFAFLITNRSLFANGAVLGFGARIVLDALFRLKDTEMLKREYFWKFAVDSKQMKNIVYIFTVVFIVLTLLA